MLLTAMLDGSRVDATTYTAEGWSELQESEDRKRMTMPLCGIRGVAKKRGESTRFFAHHSRVGCKVEHGGESPQHLAMKEALKACIDAVPGWHAIVEYPHPSREWIIDVLAESGDLKNRVAFEVQLSPQTPDKYFARSRRYFDSGVFPVWLVPRQLEYHQTKVPVVVTGFGKTSTIPEDVSELLDLPAGQDLVKAVDKLGAFVAALLLQAVNEWDKAAQADIPKAGIKPQFTKASGRRYGAFVCPSCDSVMGQYFISRIRPQKWSILSGPDVVPWATPPSTGIRVQAAVQTAAHKAVPADTPARPSPEAGRPLRCGLHLPSAPRPSCDWCRRAQS